MVIFRKIKAWLMNRSEHLKQLDGIKKKHDRDMEELQSKSEEFSRIIAGKMKDADCMYEVEIKKLEAEMKEYDCKVEIIEEEIRS